MAGKSGKMLLDTPSWVLLRHHLLSIDKPEFVKKVCASQVFSTVSVKKSKAMAAKLHTAIKRSHYNALPVKIDSNNLKDFLDILGMSEEHFWLEHKGLLSHLVIDSTTTLNDIYEDGVAKRKMTGALYAQKLISYIVIIEPGKQSGGEDHVDRQPTRDYLPFGDETAIILEGGVRMHIKIPVKGKHDIFEDTCFDLVEPGNMVQFKSGLPHYAEWLSPDRKTFAEIPSEKHAECVRSKLIIVRYPAEESRPRKNEAYES